MSGLPSRRRNWLPAVFLFLLSPTLAELLSGSAPPVEFFNPFGFVLICSLYGSGALLVRELSLSWGSGWPGRFALGAAYGIIEEGLLCKSFFDPNWQDLGPLKGYGRWAGVNWPWTEALTIYHAGFSIALPILLVELLYPERRRERWLGRGWLWAMGLLLCSVTLFGFAVFPRPESPYRPPLGGVLGATAAVAALASVGRKLRGRWPRQLPAAGPKSARPLWFGLLGFGMMLSFFAAFWGLPRTGAPPWLTMLAGPSAVGALGTSAHLLARKGWDDLRAFSLAAGAICFFIALAPLQELDKTRPDNPTGMSLVGLAALLFLLWAGLKVRRRAARGIKSP